MQKILCVCPSCKSRVEVAKPAAGLNALTNALIIAACPKCGPTAGAVVEAVKQPPEPARSVRLTVQDIGASRG